MKNLFIKYKSHSHLDHRPIRLKIVFKAFWKVGKSEVRTDTLWRVSNRILHKLLIAKTTLKYIALLVLTSPR